MPITWSSVACAEVPGTKREQASAFNGISCSVRLQCAWASRWDLISDIMSTPRPWPYLTTGFIPYPADASVVHFPDQEYVEDGQGLSTADALVDVNYSSQLVENAVETIEPSMEVVPSDFKQFKWAAGAGDMLAENEAPPKILRSMTFCRTRFRLGALPSEFLSCVWCTNDASYASSLGITFPADTLMYIPTNATRTFYDVGAGGYTATYKFAYKPEGWNKFWRAKTQANAEVYMAHSGAQYLPYTQVDFSGFWA